MKLTRDALLAAAANRSTIERETILIPELGGEVIVQGMTGFERDQWEKAVLKPAKGRRGIEVVDNVRARLAVRCLVDETGAKLLQGEDVELLGTLSSSILQRIYNVAQRLSGVSNEDIDELKKSSGGGDGNASPSPSPNASEE